MNIICFVIWLSEEKRTGVYHKSDVEIKRDEDDGENELKFSQKNGKKDVPEEEEEGEEDDEEEDEEADEEEEDNEGNDELKKEGITVSQEKRVNRKEKRDAQDEDELLKLQNKRLKGTKEEKTFIRTLPEAKKLKDLQNTFKLELANAIRPVGDNFLKIQSQEDKLAAKLGEITKLAKVDEKIRNKADDIHAELTKKKGQIHKEGYISMYDVQKVREQVAKKLRYDEQFDTLLNKIKDQYKAKFRNIQFPEKAYDWLSPIFESRTKAHARGIEGLISDSQPDLGVDEYRRLTHAPVRDLPEWKWNVSRLGSIKGYPNKEKQKTELDELFRTTGYKAATSKPGDGRMIYDGSGELDFDRWEKWYTELNMPQQVPQGGGSVVAAQGSAAPKGKPKKRIQPVQVD